MDHIHPITQGGVYAGFLYPNWSLQSLLTRSLFSYFSNLHDKRLWLSSNVPSPFLPGITELQSFSWMQNHLLKDVSKLLLELGVATWLIKIMIAYACICYR